MCFWIEFAQFCFVHALRNENFRKFLYFFYILRTIFRNVCTYFYCIITYKQFACFYNQLTCLVFSCFFISFQKKDLQSHAELFICINVWFLILIFFFNWIQKRIKNVKWNNAHEEVLLLTNAYSLAVARFYLSTSNVIWYFSKIVVR